MRQRLVCKLQRERIVALHMLVMFRKFLESVDTVWIPATRQFSQKVEGDLRTLQPLLQTCDVPQSSKHQLIRQSGIQRLPHQLKATLIILCSNQPPADAQKLFAATETECVQGIDVCAWERRWHDRSKAGECKDIDRVVMKNRNQPLRFS